jgi:hypothetical protein
VEEQVAWTAMPYQAPVLDAQGNRIGTAESLLGDEEDDIFHGIVVKLEDGRHVEIPAVKVGPITRSVVHTQVDGPEVALLDDYREEKWFHIGWGGLFRKRPEWKQD